MAVRSSRLISRETEVGTHGHMAQTLRYRVETDGPMSQLDLIDQATTATPHPIPVVYDVVEGGYVLRVSVSQQTEHNWTRAIVSVQVGQLPGSIAGVGPSTGLPTNREPVMWIERGAEQLPITRDRDNNPIVNSAKQTFDEPIIRDRPTNVFVVKRYFPSLIAIDRLNNYYDDSVNSDALLARGVGQLRYLGTETGEPVYEGTIPYWIGLTKVAVNKSGWAVQLLDRGWQLRDPATGKRTNAVDANKMPVTEPVLLDGNGQLSALPVFLTFNIYASKSYAPLFSSDPTALDFITNP